MPTTLKQPVILISGGSATSASVQAAAAMITGAGGVPLIVSDHLGRVQGKDKEGLYKEAERLLQMGDGLLVMGNNGDIDPSEYGQEKNPKTNSELYKPDGTVNEEAMARRNLETALMRGALNAGMPMFGICGGMQRINVLCGGTLYQHVPDILDTPHSEHAQQELGIPPFVPVQPVTILKDRMLGHIAEEISAVYTPARTQDENEKDRCIRLDVNSMHHQAVHHIGNGLTSAAISDDPTKTGDPYIVEAIEIDRNGPLATGPLGNKRFGVFTQWHPEFSENPLGAKISTHFAAAAREFAKLTSREHTLEEVQAENRLSALPVLKAPETGAVVRLGSMTAKILEERAARDPSFGMAV